MKSRLGLIIIIIILLGGAFYGQAELSLFAKPCSRPILFSLGSFDGKFGILQDDFLGDVNIAVEIWEQSIDKDLFEYNPEGKLKINLVYDYRQEATDKLKDLGVSIDDTKSSYDALENRYRQMTADYNQLKQNLDAKIAAYNAQKISYEQKVNYWNEQGGAPKKTVNELNAEHNSLKAQAEKIKRDQETFNSLADTINSVVSVLNRMANTLNLTVTDYNNVGLSRGQEFEEGAYVVSGRNREINIYEFDSSDKLVRVLAHELGHALGLEHVDSNAESIMYRLNQSRNAQLTNEDLTALKSLCGL